MFDRQTTTNWQILTSHGPSLQVNSLPSSLLPKKKTWEFFPSRGPSSPQLKHLVCEKTNYGLFGILGPLRSILRNIFGPHKNVIMTGTVNVAGIPGIIMPFTKSTGILK